MKNILLVDDDSTFNFLSTKTLERMGVEIAVHTALNGEQALELFQNYYRDATSLPDVILLDLNMPIMDGFGFLQAFKKLKLPTNKPIKIFVVSSSSNPDDIQRAHALGADGYLTKPLTTESLSKALEINRN